MTEVLLWLLLSVVMYFAGRYDLLKEIEKGPWDLEFTGEHQIQLRRPASRKKK